MTNDRMKMTDLFLEGTPEREVLETLLMEIEDRTALNVYATGTTSLDSYAEGALDTLQWLLGTIVDDDDEYRFAFNLDSLSGGSSGMSWE